MWKAKTIDIMGFVFVPFLLSVLSSLGFYFMDKRNVEITKVCEETDDELMGELKGFYLNAENIRTSTLSYR